MSDLPVAYQTQSVRPHLFLTHTPNVPPRVLSATVDRPALGRIPPDLRAYVLPALRRVFLAGPPTDGDRADAARELDLLYTHVGELQSRLQQAHEKETAAAVRIAEAEKRVKEARAQNAELQRMLQLANRSCHVAKADFKPTPPPPSSQPQPQPPPVPTPRAPAVPVPQVSGSTVPAVGREILPQNATLYVPFTSYSHRVLIIHANHSRS